MNKADNEGSLLHKRLGEGINKNIIITFSNVGYK